MPISPQNLLKKFKLRKINNMVVGGALAMTIALAPFAWAALLDSGTYIAGVNAQKVFTNFESLAQQAVVKAESLAQQAVAKAIDQAQQQLQNQLYEKANALAAGLQAKLTSAITDKLGAITNGPIGKLLTNTGVSLANVAGPGIPGHVDPAATQRQMTEIAAANNPLTAIATQTKIMLENQLSDRLNVTSMLDEKPGTGTCKTAPGDKCTILTALREQDAVAMEDLQRVNLAAIGFQLGRGSSFEKALLEWIIKHRSTWRDNRKNQGITA